MTNVLNTHQFSLSTAPAGLGGRRFTLALVLASAVVFCVVAPFAARPLSRVDAFIPIYESALVLLDLVTAVLLFGQASVIGTMALWVLASGYVFTALMTVVHAISFPGLFSATGLLGAGPQTTAWLYMFWHAGFPLFVIGYVLLKGRGHAIPWGSGPAIVTTVGAVAVIVAILTLLTTAGHAALPELMRGDHYTRAQTATIMATWGLSLVALLAIWQSRPLAMLDLWLTVVLSAWLCDIALAGVLNAARFDLGFYAGRTYGVLAASVLLVVLLTDQGRLHARLVEAHQALGQQTQGLEATVQERTQMLAAIVEDSDDAIISLDLDGTITSWNAAAERLFGYRAEEAIGRTRALIIPPDRQAEETTVLPRIRSGERVDHFETARRTKDQRILDVSLTMSPIRDGQGTITGVSKIVRDITERKWTEAALRQSHATTLALLDSAAEGIVIVDEGGRITSVNGQVEELFGYSQGELIGQLVEVLIPERSWLQHRQHRADYLAAPEVRAMGKGQELTGRRRDGSEVPVEISLSYIRTAGGLRVMALITDITERRTLAESSRQAEKLAALGALSAGIAHELNNPLGVIISRIELMLLEDETQALSAVVREDLQVVHRQARRMARLVQSLLAYARPMAPPRGAVDVNQVVDEVLLFAEKQLAKEGVRIVATLDRSLPPIVGDGNQLEQVLLNLLTNAQQAIDGGGEVRIVTRRILDPPGTIELIVADTGRGIPPELLSKIFEPFFTTKAAGTGLGLSITSRIVKEHGWMMHVQSAPGEGTEFTLRLTTES